MNEHLPLPPSNEQREEIIVAYRALRAAQSALRAAEFAVECAQQDYDMKHDWLIGSEQAWNEYVATAEFRNVRFER